MLLTDSIPFGFSTVAKTLLSGITEGPHGNLGTGERVFKGHITNEGAVDVTVVLEGSPDDAGYGLVWTTRATVTVKAGATGILSGAIRGTETNWRVSASSASSNGNARLEIFDKSDNLRR